ncbi:MAG: NAD(+) synthase [Muribaculaceae bacterium]|nr:NAD(+) synthase [Muribaculaceae bacterium]
MNDFGFFRVASGIPILKVGNTAENSNAIKDIALKAISEGVEVLVTPELSVTAYTCGDLFSSGVLLDNALKAVDELREVTKDTNLLLVVGAPLKFRGVLYNCAFILADGEVEGIVPKMHIPNYQEFYEKRWFHSGAGIKNREVDFFGKKVPFGGDIIFRHSGVNIGVEICEDLWTPIPPSCQLAMSGADVILNLSASPRLISKSDYISSLVAQQSARCRCVYVYTSSGDGESSTDLVFAGLSIIAENGAVLKTSKEDFFSDSLLIKDVDIEKLRNDRTKFDTFYDSVSQPDSYRIVDIAGVDGASGKEDDKLINVAIDAHPFVPYNEKKLFEHCEEIIDIQSRGLMQRLHAINCNKAVIGISGGLDSTLALLVTVRAFDKLHLDRKGIIGITMPGMATTSRTHNNAVGLMEELGVTTLEIPIGEAVALHFSDIGQDPNKFDITYENSQARERTQILMDVANKENAIVIGTGDMSELALGWCTYNGDHMSMYAVNSSVPKTLVKHLVSWFATELHEKAARILLDIVDTPISPELVPSGSDDIAQKTEDLVGPYELHDFFLFHHLRNSFSPSKIFYLSRQAFRNHYDDKTILKWLRNFYRRFFNQQFKRSCMPDGPKVGSVSLSPRGDWRMPSDASSKLWLDEVEKLEKKYM